MADHYARKESPGVSELAQFLSDRRVKRTGDGSRPDSVHNPNSVDPLRLDDLNFECADALNFAFDFVARL